MAWAPKGSADDAGRQVGMSEASVAALVLLAALAAAIWSQLPTFLDHYVISEDARQHIYWMQRLRVKPVVCQKPPPFNSGKSPRSGAGPGETYQYGSA